MRNRACDVCVWRGLMQFIERGRFPQLEAAANAARAILFRVLHPTRVSPRPLVDWGRYREFEVNDHRDILRQGIREAQSR